MRESTQRGGVANPDAARELQRRQRAANRAAVLAHYSPYSPPRCGASCGTTERLTIDHVNGGGNEHRKEVIGTARGSHAFYAWLIAQNFPPGFAILCRPCNSSKAEGENCRLAH